MNVLTTIDFALMSNSPTIVQIESRLITLGQQIAASQPLALRHVHQNHIQDAEGRQRRINIETGEDTI